MEGAALAVERKFEQELLVAHQGAAWTGAAYAGKLKAFKYYRPDRKEAQSADQMLDALAVLQDLGAPMSIEKIN
jgi:hypothetical protein